MTSTPTQAQSEPTSRPLPHDSSGGHGIQSLTKEELDRAKTGVKAATIMQGESTSARAGSIAHDFFIRGRIRTLEEVKSAIDAVTLDQVNAYLKKNRPEKFTIVTVGPKKLKMPE